MNEVEFKRRTKQLALDVIRLTSSLPRDPASAIISRQLIRCGTSVGANYRSACRGRSVGDVLSRLAIVEEEADETVYWLEILVEAGMVARGQVEAVLDEANQIVAMTVASILTLRARNNVPPKSKI